MINLKTLIVYQGTVESIATKSPKDLTEFLEEFCGFVIYNNLKKIVQLCLL